MYITLYRKYRPKDFEDVAGEKEIVRTLKNSLKNNRLSHAYLFTGPRGVGKTSIARLMAKGINCLTGITDTPCNVCENCLEISKGSFLDLIEIDAASNRGIDEIRQLKEKVNYAPNKGRKKIYIIDEVHMLTKEAFNALLKTLEEPPEHVVFILATTEPDKILATIISRCQRYDFKAVSYEEMRKRLEYITTQEGYEVDEKTFEIVYEFSEGSMRDSLSILERVIMNLEGKEIKSDEVEKILGITPTAKLDEMIELLFNDTLERAVEYFESSLKEIIDTEAFFKDIAKRVKRRVVDGTLDLKKGIELIDIIYDILTKFRYEEDKKLLGYIILNRAFSKEEKAIKEVVVEKVIYSNEKTLEEASDKKAERVSNLTETEVKSSWGKIVEEAKKRKITFSAFLIKANYKSFRDGVLTIEFPPEQNFSRTMMETEPYKSIFEEVITDILGEKLIVAYEIQGQVTKKVEEESISKKIIDFFGGEVL